MTPEWDKRASFVSLSSSCPQGSAWQLHLYVWLETDRAVLRPVNIVVPASKAFTLMITNHTGDSTAILTRHSNLGRRSAAVAVWRNADVFNVDILKPALGTGKAYKGCDPIRC